MRALWLLGIVSVALYGAVAVKVGDKYKDSGKCKSCHSHIVTQWENSWHAKSHYANDEYFRKTIDYVARKNNRKSLNTVKIECAACHNPRISVTSTSAEYEAIAALNLDKDTAAAKALKSDTISEGINCVVCHNIDQIHDNLPEAKRGIHRVTWMKSGTMTGPYDDASSPYHRIEKRDFMDSNPDQLCFVCHANDTSEEGYRFTDMKSEFKSGGKQCVDCHMGTRKMGLASTLRDAKGNTQKRLIRDHKFQGGHTESMWLNALNAEVKKTGNALSITLTNPQPHALPSGFGAREILIEVQFVKGGKSVKTETISLTSRYLNKRGKPTIPHLAAKSVENGAIAAHGSKNFLLPLAAGADGAKVIVSYRLVNDEVRNMLELKEPIWSKKMLIQTVSVKL